MVSQAQVDLRELILDDKKFVETLLEIEDKSTRVVPFMLNPIQADSYATSTGRDIYVKPAQVGFSSAIIARRLKSALVNPGTNIVLIAYEDFITERLLAKVNFYVNHLVRLNIPGLPEVSANSKYEKSFEFKIGGRVISTSSIYIASARSYVAGRAETIHHLIADEFAFWAAGANERILMPAMQRVPPTGTVDILSTPNGENDFHDIYKKAKEGNSVFTPHFYPWFMHPEYQIQVGDKRLNMPALREANQPEFTLTADEQTLITAHPELVTFDKIRWRRWKIFETESLKRQGETRILFGQEFPEDDISCFLASGDQYFDTTLVNQLAATCFPAPGHREGAHIWYPPEKDARNYIVCIDPGQAKITRSAIEVWKISDTETKLCARDAGWYTPEVTLLKGISLAQYYNYALLSWEANSHGLALSALIGKTQVVDGVMKDFHYSHIYYRTDIVSGAVSSEMGWYTKPNLRDYMLLMIHRKLPVMTCHDNEFISELRNIRQIGDKVVVVGANDLVMSAGVGFCSWIKPQMNRGFQGTSGWQKR